MTMTRARIWSPIGFPEAAEGGSRLAAETNPFALPLIVSLFACTGIEPDVDAPLPAQGATTSIDQPMRCEAVDYPILLTSTRGDSVNGLELYIVDFDGKVRQIGHGPRFIAPVWSPDGRAVAFRHQVAAERGVTIASEVQLMAPDGNERVSLTPRETLPFDDHSVLPVDAPSWSPDGQSLAFAAADGVGGYGLWQVARDGGEPRPILASAHSRHSPAWAPQLGVIAFVGDDDGSEDIWIADVGDPERPLRNLTRGRLQQPRSPRWAPDGKSLAFSAIDPLPALEGGGDFEVYVIDATTSDITVVTGNDTPDLHPVWSPDGAELLMTRGLSPADARPLDTLPFEVWRVPLSDPTRAERVVSEGWMDCATDWFSGSCSPP